MAASRLIVRLSTGVLAPGASIVIPHGLNEGVLPVVPNVILPDRSTAIVAAVVTSVDVTFTNTGVGAEAANFFVWRVHTINEDPTTLHHTLGHRNIRNPPSAMWQARRTRAIKSRSWIGS